MWARRANWCASGACSNMARPGSASSPRRFSFGRCDRRATRDQKRTRSAGGREMNGPARATALAGRAAGDVLSSLRFFTRLPLPTRETEPPDWAQIAWSAPFAGAIVGAIGGLALVVANELSLPPFLAATLAIAALALTTGALHEDGLADVADGFGGGSTREAKLAIMRDSRIGAFGAIALVLSLLLRVGALASLQRHSPGFAFAGLVLANAA